jgi:hypothetical protein
MIDTDKYEGHTPAPWRVSPNSRYKIRADENLPEGVHHWHIAQVMNNRGGKWENMCKANAQLIADAPLLLAEVKRLREENNRYLDFIFWLDKGKELAWEYGDEKLAEMIE